MGLKQAISHSHEHAKNEVAWAFLGKIVSLLTLIVVVFALSEIGALPVNPQEGLEQYMEVGAVAAVAYILWQLREYVQNFAVMFKKYMNTGKIQEIGLLALGLGVGLVLASFVVPNLLPSFWGLIAGFFFIVAGIDTYRSQRAKYLQSR